MNKVNKNIFKNLIKEEIRKIINEGERIGSNLSVGEFEDNVIITQNSGGNDSLSTQKVQISYNDLPAMLDSIFSKVPMNQFPAEYRKSMIAKLADGIANTDTQFSDEAPGEAPAPDAAPDGEPTGPDEVPADAAPAPEAEPMKGTPVEPDEEEQLKESIRRGKAFVKSLKI